MVNPKKSIIQDDMEALKKEDKESMAADVQSHLISNYRDALKKGDKGAAKSCLLAARCFAQNDPNVANEIYIMAKSDGDICEASKSFVDIFNYLLASTKDESISKGISAEITDILDRMKEEMKTLLCELESLHLKLKTPSAHVSSANRRKNSNLDQGKGRVSKANNCSTTRKFSYQALFDNLPDDTKRGIFDYAIETCDNPIEKCVLIMLNINLFPDDVESRGTRLLQILIDLSDDNKKPDKLSDTGPSTETCSQTYYKAGSLLVLDAIPLVLNHVPLSNLDIDVVKLFKSTLSYTSEQCLEEIAKETNGSEMQEEVKKFIARRILGMEQNCFSLSENEKYSRITFNLLCDKFLDTCTSERKKVHLGRVKSLVLEQDSPTCKLDQIARLLDDSKDEKGEDVADKTQRQEVDKPVVTTPPPKTRGRPKKIQQPVNGGSEETVKKSKPDLLSEDQFIYFSLVHYIFQNLSSYFRCTRSRVIMNFENPLIDMVEVEPTKEPAQQRTSRSKTGSQQSNESVARAPKRIKLDLPVGELDSNLEQKTSPLNSELSRKLDMQVMSYIAEAYNCSVLLSVRLSNLWSDYINGLYHCAWLQRFLVDGNMISCKYENLSFILKQLKQLRSEQGINQTSTADVLILRTMIQDIASQVSMKDKINSLVKIEQLFTFMSEGGFLISDESYACGNTLQGYKVIVPHQGQVHLGFLFFDTVSIIRYCVDILMNMLKKYLTSGISISDALIGHIIVLSQFDWPKEFRTYRECVSWIRDQKPKSTTPQSLSAATKFTYQDFFRYIRNATVIEDFMAMLCQGYTLDIKDSITTVQSATHSSQSRNGNSNSGTNSRAATNSSASRTNKAITTRGVNKTFKEDLKVAFVTQMKISSFVVPLDVISEFIRISLIPYLKSFK